MSGGLFDRLQNELNAREKARGLSMTDLLSLPDAERKLMNWLLDRQEASFSELVTQAGESKQRVRAMVDALVMQGFLRKIERGTEEENVGYQVRFARKRGASLPLNIWSALDEKIGKSETGQGDS